MVSAGYLEYDPANRRFILPPEHAPALAQEASPVFFGGIYQEVACIDWSARPAHASLPCGRWECHSRPTTTILWDGMERFTIIWFENLLLQHWIPAMPDVQAKLERGALVADVGCGRGRALIKLAQAFPNSRYVGYDRLLSPSIARATANAQAAGVAERLTFHQRDVSQGLPEQYDVITTFDVVHDAVDPVGLLRTIRQGLRADGALRVLRCQLLGQAGRKLWTAGRSCSMALASSTA